MKYYQYIYSPLKNLYLRWKYRKEIREVKRRYTRLGEVNVICDHRNNSEEDIKNGKFNVDFVVPKPIPYIRLDFMIDKYGEIQFTEIVNGNTINRVENTETPKK